VRLDDVIARLGDPLEVWLALVVDGPGERATPPADQRHVVPDVVSDQPIEQRQFLVALAQVALAGLYENGEVTGTPDYRMAARWYRRAAEQGDAVAQMNLGNLYARGLGVGRDDVAAWVWLARAARQGRDWAAERRNEIAEGMSAAALAAARRRFEGGESAPAAD
jgi:TPR repeat protein